MRKLAVALAFFLSAVLWAQYTVPYRTGATGSGGGGGGIALVAHGAAQSPNSGTPIGPLNMTGATLLVCGTNNDGGGSVAGDIVDSSSNTWTLAPNGITSGVQTQIFYAYNPTVTSSMTFWLSAGNVSLFCAGFESTLTTSGVIDTATALNSGANALTVQPGSITPAGSGELFFTVVGVGQSSQQPISVTSPAGFTTLDSITFSANSGGASAYYVNSGSTAVNPTWTANANVNWLWSAQGAFKP